jgi:hypothetical protein
MTHSKIVKLAMIGVSCLTLQACGGGSAGGEPPSISITDVKKGLAPDVKKAVEGSGTFEKVKLVASLHGSNGAPKVVSAANDDAPGQFTVNGKTYNLYYTNFDPAEGATDDASSETEYASSFLSAYTKPENERVNGVESILSLKKDSVTSEKLITRYDYIFYGKPTSVADLPKATAQYLGQYNYFGYFDGVLLDAPEEGKFTAIADFGSAQKVTGSFFNPENGSDEIAKLDANIVQNGFVGKIKAVNGDQVQLDTGGIFTGSGASSLIGAGQNDTTGSMFVYSADKQ